jgi:phage terminase large subunit-like protein
MDAFTPEHFREYVAGLVFDDGESRPPQDWQLEVVADVFKGFPETWLIVPEGNGKSTLLAQLALYGADFSDSPWIPVGASSAKQARIIFDQAAGFVERTPWLDERFKCFGGYKLIRSIANGGIGIEVFAAEAKTGDGVIPFPFAIVDELHRHEDLRLYSLWKGKLRKRGGQILTISTAGEPETPFENTRDEIRRRATKRDRVGAHLRAEGPGLVLHEWMVPSDELCSDMDAVKAANPLWSITATVWRRISRPRRWIWAIGSV